MEKHILICDLGSTSVRAIVISSTTFEILGSAKYEIPLIQFDDGTCEIDQNELFLNIVRILRQSLKDAMVGAENILCLGIATQRVTFALVDRVTGEPFHRLISWYDRRANNFVEEFNNGCTTKLLRGGSALLYWITRKEIFKQGTRIKLMNSMLVPRLSHLLHNNKKFRDAVKSGRAVVCNIDTWILNRLKNFEKFENFDFVSDIANASATGIYDPFYLKYLSMFLKILNIEEKALAKVVDNSYDFGYIHKGILGVPIKIATLITDQSASMIGNGCFSNTDVKVTLGTGTFININTGHKCMGSRNGAYPLITYDLQTKKNKKFVIYNYERQFGDSTTLIRFAKSVGLCTNVEELSDMALSVADSDGVIFIPKFYSMAGFVGYKQSTTKNHFVRAVLESLVFTVAHFYFLSKEDTNFHFGKLRVDGGISANAFVCQSLADLISIPIERGVNSTQITSIGCAYLSAYICGIFDELDNVSKLYEVERTFYPNEINRKELFERYEKFLRLTNRYD